MIWFRRITFSLVSLAALIAAVYFSFFVPEPNPNLTGIWLTFALFTFAFGWPEIAKSISFLGNSIELRELKKEVATLKKYLKSYWAEIQKTTERTQKETGLALPININASFLDIDKELSDNISELEDTVNTISGRLEGIWEEACLFFKENGMDTAKIEGLPYYQNPLINPEWETINLGVPNSFLHVRQLVTQLAIKHYELLVAQDGGLQADHQERLEILKEQLKGYSQSIIAD